MFRSCKGVGEVRMVTSGTNDSHGKLAQARTPREYRRITAENLTIQAEKNDIGKLTVGGFSLLHCRSCTGHTEKRGEYRQHTGQGEKLRALHKC